MKRIIGTSREGEILCVLILCLGRAPVAAQQFKLTGHVEIYVDDTGSQKKEHSDAVVWLVPAESPAQGRGSWPSGALQHRYVVVQRDHTFVPHMLIVPVGSTIEFPNRDVIFHNAFSLFDGKRFDLGLYESGTSRAVHVDKPGISYVFCNIHYQMSAIVVALGTPYYGVPDHDGLVTIAGVPQGQYKLKVWVEGASAEALDQLSRNVSINDDASLGIMRVAVVPAVTITHKNKYGNDYDPAASNSPYDSRSRE